MFQNFILKARRSPAAIRIRGMAATSVSEKL
jgi:hypothetical protein